MILNAWRIVKAKHAHGAFSGKGAEDYGGRWNSTGVPVVYASGTMALASLETLVHIALPFKSRWVAFPIQFDDQLVQVIPLGSLPKTWAVEPPSGDSQRIGDEWVKAGRSPVLAVPSVIIPQERNYLLNPMHPNFQMVHIGAPVTFSFDPRFR